MESNIYPISGLLERGHFAVIQTHNPFLLIFYCLCYLIYSFIGDIKRGSVSILNCTPKVRHKTFGVHYV